MSRNQEIKEKIQRAAKGLFALNGYSSTSTRDIVSEAGANISAIAYHFGSKENLFVSLFDNFEFWAEDHSGPFDSPVSELKELLNRIIGLRFEDPELVTILQQEVVVQSNRSEAIKERLLPLWTRIRLLLEQGRDVGDFQFRSSYNAVNFVMAVAVFPRHNPFFQEVVDKKESKEELINEMIGMIFKGLECKSSDPGVKKS